MSVAARLTQLRGESGVEGGILKQRPDVVLGRKSVVLRSILFIFSTHFLSYTHHQDLVVSQNVSFITGKNVREWVQMFFFWEDIYINCLTL